MILIARAVGGLGSSEIKALPNEQSLRVTQGMSLDESLRD